jgi:hypothetical protein
MNDVSCALHFAAATERTGSKDSTAVFSNADGQTTMFALPLNIVLPPLTTTTSGPDGEIYRIVIVAPPMPGDASKPACRPCNVSTTPLAFCNRLLRAPPATAKPAPAAE